MEKMGLTLSYGESRALNDRAWEQLCVILRCTPEAAGFVVDGLVKPRAADKALRFIASPSGEFVIYQELAGYNFSAPNAAIKQGGIVSISVSGFDPVTELGILAGAIAQTAATQGIDVPANFFQHDPLNNEASFAWSERQSRYLGDDSASPAKRWPDLSPYGLRMQFWASGSGEDYPVIYGGGLQDEALRSKIAQGLHGTWLEQYQAVAFQSGFSTADLKAVLPFARVGEQPFSLTFRAFKSPQLFAAVIPSAYGLRPILEAQLLEEADRSVTFDQPIKELALRHPDQLLGLANNGRGKSLLTPGHFFSLQETLEGAMSGIGRKLGERFREEGDWDETFRTAVAVYHAMPVAKYRTGTSVALQQFSTPLPMALAAQRASGMDYASDVFEPTIGNGLLVSMANPEKVQGIELDKTRHRAVSRLFPQVFNADALNTMAVPQSADIVLANPPFGAIDSGPRDYRDAETGLTIRLGRQDRMIALNALGNLRDKGGATLILGADNYLQKSGEMDDTYRSFLAFLHDHYTVIGHVAVDGKLYERHGAAFPVRMIVLAGRSPSAMPVPDVLPVIDSWEALYQFAESMHEIQDRLYFDDELKATYIADRPRGLLPVTASSISEADMEGVQIDGPSDTVVELEDAPVDELDGVVDDENPVIDFDPESVTVEPRSADEANEIVLNENMDAVEYGNPGSRMPGLGSIMPQNLAQPTFDAISRLSDEVGGDLDAFVARELKWTKEEMAGYLAAEQVDSVALAISNLKNGKGFIIGDMTGIGKGRQVAAMLRWSLVNGITPIFVTEKANLFMDMVRDLNDIGSGRLLNPFVLNDGEKIRDPETGDVLMESASKAELTRAFEMGTVPPEYNAVFMTYSQINQSPNRSKKASWMLSMIKENHGVVVLDESHNAGGDSQTGQNLKEILSEAQGVVYSSATYAKFPQNMGIYFRTDMFAGSTTDEVINALVSGGRVTQEIMSTMLAASGQYIRRQHAIPMTVRFDRLPESEQRDRELAHELSGIYRRMMLLQNAAREFAVERTKQMRSDFKDANTTGGSVDPRMIEIVKKMRQDKEDPKVIQKGIGCDSANFTSDMWRLNAQFLLSLNAEGVAKRAVEALAAGEKPIIVVENTMESFIEEEIEAVRQESGDYTSALEDLKMSMDFRDILTRKIHKFSEVTERVPYGESKKVRLFDIDEQRGYYNEWRAGDRSAAQFLDPLAKEIFELEGFVYETFPSVLPASPIDWVRHRVMEAGYSIGEITGRKKLIEYAGVGAGKFAKRPSEEIKNRNQTIRRFNFADRDNLDGLIINAAGSTGASLHASVNFTDQRPRHMFMLQPNLNVNIVMQTFGRILRTGLVEGVTPKYTFCNSSIPLESRPMAILRSKMASLSANTSSDQKTALDEVAGDMMNKYGDRAALNVLRANPSLAEVLGFDLEQEMEKIKLTGESQLMRRMTGRLGMLPVFEMETLKATQDAVYERLEEAFNAVIDREIQAGRSPLASQFFDMKGIEVERTCVVPDKGEGVFQRGVDAIEVEYTKEVQAQSWDDVKAMLEAGYQRMREDFPGCDPRLGINGVLNASQALRESLREELNTAYAAGSDMLATDEEKALMAKAHDEASNFIYVLGQPANPSGSENYLSIGTLYRNVNLPGTEEVDDVVLGFIQKGRSKSPLEWRFKFFPVEPQNDAFSLTLMDIINRQNATNPGRDDTRFPRYYDAYNRMVAPQVRMGWKSPAHEEMLANLFDNEGKMVEIKRRAVLLDGNLLEAVKLSKQMKMGSPVIYTKADGLRYRGVMMPQHATLKKVENQVQHRFHSTECLMDFIKEKMADVLKNHEGQAFCYKEALASLRVSGFNDITAQFSVWQPADSPVLSMRIRCPGVKKNFGALFTHEGLNALGEASTNQEGFAGNRASMHLFIDGETKVEMAINMLARDLALHFEIPEQSKDWYKNYCKKYAVTMEKSSPSERVDPSLDGKMAEKVAKKNAVPADLAYCSF